MTTGSPRWVLQLEGGGEIPLAGTNMTIGSAPVTDLQLPATAGVARVHAEITRAPEGMVIRSVGDAKIRVNGELTQSHVLELGDEIRIGRQTVAVAEAGVGPSDSGHRTFSSGMSDTSADVAPSPSSVAALLQLVPLWLQGYILLMLLVGVFLAFGQLGQNTASLASIQQQESEYAQQRGWEPAETALVLRLLRTAVAHEDRGSQSSALNLYYQVVSVRSSEDRRGPAFTFAVQRIAVLQTGR